MELNDRQLLLLEFVKQQHDGQLRKYTNDPYWTHPLDVAKIVDKFDKTLGLIEISLCHDLFEDTKTNYEVLSTKMNEIGYSTTERIFVCRGVESLTDTMTSENYPHFNRGKRKQFEAHRLAKIGAHYQTVKYADLIHNTSSIIKHDVGFSKKYIPEKRYILNLMRNGNIDLFIECYKTLISAEEELLKHK